MKENSQKKDVGIGRKKAWMKKIAGAAIVTFSCVNFG